MKYPLEVKIETVRKHREEGVSIRALAEQLGASPSTVRRWVASTRANGGPDASFRHRPGCYCIRCWRHAFC